MKYWEACEAQVTVAEAIEECRKHGITAVVREPDNALIDKDTGEVIGRPDDCGEFMAAMSSASSDIDRRPFVLIALGVRGKIVTRMGEDLRASFD